MRAPAKASGRDFISLGGRNITLHSLWDAGKYDREKRQVLHEEFANAVPFPHLVVDQLFDPTLLEIISEEFDHLGADGWRHSKSDNESTRRSLCDAELTPAADLYFSKIYSRDFLQFLHDVTGVDGLIPDAELIGGGLHESKTGDWFNIHVDFARHPKTRLSNEMVLISYLNKDWREEYGGSLELWDNSTKSCAKSIAPIFGRTVILKNGKASLHGHTKPVCAPDGRPRRSVAAYYYSQRETVFVSDESELGSAFLLPRKTVLYRIKTLAFMVSPPIMIQIFKHLRKISRPNSDWVSSIDNAKR